jgi:hypothetical protein
MTLSAQQKLVRLAEIHRQGRRPDITDEHRDALQGLCDQIIGDVHLPPHELGGLNDPEAWAKAMHNTLGVQHETALAWMLGAMAAAKEHSYSAGVMAGSAAVVETRASERQALLDAVHLVLVLVDRRQIRPPMVRDENDPDNPARPLREYLVEALRMAGEHVE